MNKTFPPVMLAFAALLALHSASQAASAGPSPAGGKSGSPSPAPASAPPGSNPGSPGSSADPTKEVMVPDDSSASRNAARTRMHECGHQWSTLKKSGGASGLTWKEFSQGCLARK